ncbi:glycosyltransferase family 4 protein [Stygiolobus caldivivus]|uniref:Glycosyl transferase family 1 domain-containing protein n=1 Tax=Stygiolobus caldivivus TaxID=2824673 RepID=A0A8D5ZK18_9CREN|nr:glycosyltransferase [Stygiolobus caldivivus]BCU70920.1 hypothetical protein KN1_22170 [Stygiolobus caldivivus]
MIRILYVSIGEPTLSGATTIITEIIKRSKAFGISFGILELLGKKDRSITDVYPQLASNIEMHKIIRIPFSTRNIIGKSYRYLLRNVYVRYLVNKYLKEYDFVIGFWTSKTINILYLEPFLKFPLYKFWLNLIRKTNPIEGTIWFLNTYFSYRRARKNKMNICLGKVLMEKVYNEFGLECKPLEPPAGIDLDLINKSEPLGEFSFDAINVARQGFMKGTPDTIYVMKELKKYGYNSFAIVGPADNGFDIEKYIADTEGIKYFGKVEDKSYLYSIMKSSKIMVYPSYVDSFGIVVAEALANGIPVVAYDIPAIKYYYGDCKAVKLVKTGDKESLLKATLEFLSSYKEYRDVALECAKKYSWDSTVYSFSSIVKSFKEGNRL